MRTDIIFINEESVKEEMLLNNIDEVVLYITAYVDNNNYQSFGFSVENINSDYYYQQGTIATKVQTFNIN